MLHVGSQLNSMQMGKGCFSTQLTGFFAVRSFSMPGFLMDKFNGEFGLLQLQSTFKPAGVPSSAWHSTCRLLTCSQDACVMFFKGVRIGRCMTIRIVNTDHKKYGF
jgi:hypothetical protein